MANQMDFESSPIANRALRSAAVYALRRTRVRSLFSGTSLPCTRLFLALLTGMCIWLLHPPCPAAQQLETLRGTIGRRDAMVVIDPSGTPIFSQNAQARLIPASTLKLFTSLVGLHYLGEDYRFRTEFYLDDHSNLKVKGYGDPLLISEVLQRLAQKLALELKPRTSLEDLVLDDSHFAQPLTIPGITSSYEPYDAPNGALCANFNSVEFTHSSNGYVSAEPQTPLLPFALQKIKASGLKSGRIVFSHHHNEITRYFGLLMQYFLNRCGISFRGQVKLGRVDPQSDHLIYTYRSEFALTQVVSKLLEFSNNFMINQILIETGAHVQGAPGTLEKGVTTALDYARNRLHLQMLSLVEGSGISRENRISASDMAIVLKHFEPYRALMPRDGPEYYKTGTLQGVSTKAGFIQSPAGTWYRYVVMLNTPGKFTRPIVERLRSLLESTQTSSGE
jgi:D-alanyl-D-alanine carboxypeptidase/D-alanyl-D-alanine-endopeptidase (penicillin-binding protein 4)